jgi:dihydrofolate reductase
MTLSAIVAAAENNVIGKNNFMPWTLPADLKYFKEVTWGQPVIMGRKTFDSMGGKPLPGRRNIIITRQKDWYNSGVEVVHSLSDAVAYARGIADGEIFISGGEEIFRQSMSLLHRIYLTRIHANFDGDTFFPVLKESEWKMVKNEAHQPDAKNKYAYDFQVWEKQEFK